MWACSVICRKATFTVSVSAVTLSNAILRLPEHKNGDFVLGDDCREHSSAHWSSALPASSPPGCIWQQCARQQIAATYHATCRQDLPAGHTTVHTPANPPPRNLPPCMLPGTAPCIPPWRYRKKLPPCATAKSYRLGATAEELPQKATAVCCPRTTYLPGILPRDGSRAQRAGDSDVGANDKGAGDDPGDGVDAH